MKQNMATHPLTFQFWVGVFVAGKSHFGRGLYDGLALAQKENIDVPAVPCTELLASQHKATLQAIPDEQTARKEWDNIW